MNGFLQFILIFAIAIFACAKVLIQGRFSRNEIHTVFDSIRYNGFVFIFVALFLLLLFPQAKIDGKMLMWSSLTAVGMLAFQVSYTLALKLGPVSLSVLICNFNVLLNMFFCIFFYKETVYITHIIGIALMIVTLILSSNTDKAHKGSKTDPLWILALALAVFTSAAYSIIQKYYGATVSNGDQRSSVTFLVLTYAIGSALSTAILLIFRPKKEKNAISRFDAKIIYYGAATAVALAAFQKLYMYAVVVTDAVFMMPTYSGLQSLCMSIIGVILFKDKLSRRQLIGIVCGIASIVVLNLNMIAL